MDDVMNAVKGLKTGTSNVQGATGVSAVEHAIAEILLRMAMNKSRDTQHVGSEAKQR